MELVAHLDRHHFIPVAVAAMISATERNAGPTKLVAQVPVELRVWIRDKLNIQGEAMTTALTFSIAFPEPPTVLNSHRLPQGTRDWLWLQEQILDDNWSSTPWPHSVLLTLDEHSDGALTHVWRKVNATSQAGHRVAVVLQEVKPRPRTPSHVLSTDGGKSTSLLSGRHPSLWTCSWLGRRYQRPKV